MIEFSIVGAGWRTEFFLRIAEALPERFRVTGVQVRNPEKAAVFAARWNVRTVATLDELLSEAGAFVVVSVSWLSAPEVLRELAGRKIVTLCETPPAPDLAALNSLYAEIGTSGRVQVAEQYHLQPLHSARQAVIDSGKLGEVSQAQVSVAHGYHGVSLMRRFLGIGFEDATIRAIKFESPLIEGPGRDGPPTAEKRGVSHQTIATLDFGGKLGVFDFTGDQYFSWIRSERILIRGERGEMNNLDIRWLESYHTPIRTRFERIDRGGAGNLEGVHNVGYQAGCDWVYKNPTAPATLSDDEIAIATALLKTAEYADSGAGFYGLAEASQDHYLGMLIDQAAASGEVVRSERQGWAG